MRQNTPLSKQSYYQPNPPSSQSYAEGVNAALSILVGTAQDYEQMAESLTRQLAGELDLISKRTAVIKHRLYKEKAELLRGQIAIIQDTLL